MRTPTDPPSVPVVAVWPHHDRPADLVRELKYGRATTVVTELAEAMADRAPSADVLTWVPASPARRRRRGFDQGELLARAIARRLGIPVRRLLRRVDDDPQTARGRDGRLEGPSLVATGRRLRFRPHVLLVDDVCTTGATLRAAGAVLVERGAGAVTGLVATRAVGSPAGAPGPAGVYHRVTTSTTGG
jgi:predicted amidophosphoribosyltransferase